jgi:type VI protein secretion system component VasF
VKRVNLAAVAVNKASDQYVKAEEVAPAGPSVRWGIDPEAANERQSPRAREPRRARRRASTAQRLQRAASELDAELQRLYERFCDAELTAAEMRAQQNDRIRAFNAAVRRENIRYRSFLRRTL